MTDTPKVIALDLFGTVFDLANVPREEIRAYLGCCIERPYRPQQLPESWKSLPAFADSAEGIRRLRTKFKVVTLSNCPMEWMNAMSVKAGIKWDDFTPLESYRTYKPDPLAYLGVCQRNNVKPADVMMVTANPRFGPFPFGDIEMAKLVGMQTALIRQNGCPQTIIELAEQLGC